MNEKLIITFLLPGQGHGGGVRAIAEFGNGLLTLGNEVRIIFKKDKPSSTLKHFVHTLIGRSGRNWLDLFHGKIESYIANLKHISFKDDEIVISMCSQTTLDAWLLPSNVKKVFHCHGGEYENWDNFMKAINLPIHKIAISSHVKKMIKKHSQSKDIPIVFNGINHLEYYRDTQIIKQGVGGCIRPRHSKDADTTIKTFQLLHSISPETPLYSFGIGKKPSIHPILNFTTNPSINKGCEIYNKCKIWFLASLEEGFGLPVLEAMACGCVVVSTKCGGPQDLIIDGYNGYNVEIGNYGGLVEKICKVLQDERLFQELSENAIKTAQKYSWDNASLSLETALLKLSEQTSIR
jgi:glycosyltransferase involved in cell wall biosynthesis